MTNKKLNFKIFSAITSSNLLISFNRFNHSLTYLKLLFFLLKTYSDIKLRPVEGTQIMMKMSSAMARFKISIFVLLRIFRCNRIVSSTIVFPIMPTINVMMKVIPVMSEIVNSKSDCSFWDGIIFNFSDTAGSKIFLNSFYLIR